MPGRKIVIDDIPYSADEIINSSVEKFREMKSKLTAEQCERMRMFRLTGKNTIAVRNGRKRKSDEVSDLTIKLNESRKFGEEMLKKKENAFVQRDEVKEQLAHEINRILVSHNFDPQTHTMEFGENGEGSIVEF